MSLLLPKAAGKATSPGLGFWLQRGLLAGPRADESPPYGVVFG